VIQTRKNPYSKKIYSINSNIKLSSFAPEPTLSAQLMTEPAPPTGSHCHSTKIMPNNLVCSRK